jgi:sulfite reductase (NADPH) flavoprotein alpha-component
LHVFPTVEGSPRRLKTTWYQLFKYHLDLSRRLSANQVYSIVGHSLPLEIGKEGMTFVSFVEAFKSSISLDELLRTVSPIFPRLFSVSNRVHNGRNWIELLVGLMDDGLCSPFMRKAGQLLSSPSLLHFPKLSVFPKKSPQLIFPSESSKPLILIGFGTGISPLRSFLQRLGDQKATEWTIFLIQACETTADQFFREEMQQLIEAGVLFKYVAAKSKYYYLSQRFFFLVCCSLLSCVEGKRTCE